MKNSLNLKNKNITVMGLGLNQGGLGVTRFLAECGANVLVTDLKTGQELEKSLTQLNEYKNIRYVLGEHRIQDFMNRDMIIQNPAVPSDSEYLQIAKSYNIPIETDLSLFLRLCPSQNFIAVGGTKGKSTVSKLIYHTLFQAQQNIVYAGNIGISVFEVLPQITTDTIVLLEISSWQLEGLTQTCFKPRIAVLTNILADHLDRYANFGEYAQAEKLITCSQDYSDYLITNFDNLYTKDLAYETRANIFWFSTRTKLDQGCYLEGDKMIYKSGDKTIEFGTIFEIPLPGIHNIGNILAAANVFFLYELPLSAIREGIMSFPGVPNRLEKIATFNGITFYNDTCATTPDATIVAIQSFLEKPLIIILGGKDKKLNYDELVQAINKNKNIIHLLVLRHPEYNASKIIWQELQKLNLDKKAELCDSMSEAVQRAYQKATPETNIILSPAAASFGMFVNEFERGNAFRQAVGRLN